MELDGEMFQEPGNCRFLQASEALLRESWQRAIASSSATEMHGPRRQKSRSEAAAPCAAPWGPCWKVWWREREPEPAESTSTARPNQLKVAAPSSPKNLRHCRGSSKAARSRLSACGCGPKCAGPCQRLEDLGEDAERGASEIQLPEPEKERPFSGHAQRMWCPIRTRAIWSP